MSSVKKDKKLPRISVIKYKLYKKKGKVDIDKTARKMAESIVDALGLNDTPK
jgi:hypothetical protein